MLLAEKEANKDIALVENQIVVIKEAAKAKSAKCSCGPIQTARKK